MCGALAVVPYRVIRHDVLNKPGALESACL